MSRGSRISFWSVFVPVCLVAAVALRLVWLQDMEYKDDEKLTFALSQTIGRTSAWPTVGTMSGVGVVNPSLSVWIFVILGRLFRAENPIDLTRAVEVVNVGCVFALFAFVLRWLKDERREAWLWAAAMLSVNPFSVLFSRKIWPQDVLAPFLLATIIGFLNRTHLAGAVTFGFFGALLGQVHMSGFFLALGLIVWLAVFDRKSVNWLGWLAGSALGAIPLIPWLKVFPIGAQGLVAAGRFNLRFFRLWLEDIFGLGLNYSLGPHFRAFLKFPSIGNSPTFAVGVVHVALGAAMIVFLVCLLRGLATNRSASRALHPSSTLR